MDDPFDIVPAAVAILRQGERVLLLRRREHMRAYPGLWALPGGRVDPGERAEVAVVREVLEETGLHVSVVATRPPRQARVEARRRVYEIAVFEVVMTPATQALMDYPSEEHAEARWCRPDEALTRLTLAGPVTRGVLEALDAEAEATP